MNITSLFNIADCDLKYIAGEINFVDSMCELANSHWLPKDKAPDSKSEFINTIDEILQTYKQNINKIIERYLHTKEEIRKRNFENICNINTDQLSIDDEFLNKIRNYDRQIFNLTRMQLHVHVNWYLEHYDPDHDNYPAIQKIEQLCAQAIAQANTMKISFNTYVVRKYEQGKIK